MRLIDEQGPRCPKCKIIVIKLVSVSDDGKGRKICRRCKKKIRGKEKMVQKKQLKISEMSIDRLRVYGMNYKLVSPVELSEEDEKKFYIENLIAANKGEDNVGASVDSSKYKGVNSCVCSKCGEEKAVRPDVYAKRVEKFGSEEKLKENYKCMECRRKER